MLCPFCSDYMCGNTFTTARAHAPSLPLSCPTSTTSPLPEKARAGGLSFPTATQAMRTTSATAFLQPRWGCAVAPSLSIFFFTATYTMPRQGLTPGLTPTRYSIKCADAHLGLSQPSPRTALLSTSTQTTSLTPTNTQPPHPLAKYT